MARMKGTLVYAALLLLFLLNCADAVVTFYPCFTTDNCADGTMMTQQIDPADCCAMMGIMAFEGTDGVCAPCGGSTIVALPPSGFEQDEGFSGSLNFTFAEVSGMAEGVNITIAFADDLASSVSGDPEQDYQFMGLMTEVIDASSMVSFSLLQLLTESPVIIEGPETFNVTLSTTDTGVTLLNPGPFVFTIGDSDPADPEIMLTFRVNGDDSMLMTEVSRMEDAALNVEVCARDSSGRLIQNLAVTLQFDPDATDTAINGSDYNIASTEIVFPANATNLTCVDAFSIIDDGVLEPEENFTIGLSQVDFNVNADNTSRLTFSITSGAAEQVTITLSAASMVDEGAMLEIGFTAVDGNGTAIMSDFDFVLTYTDDIAVEGSDYTANTNASYSGTTMSGTVMVLITDDDLLERTQSFNVTAVLGANAANTFIIAAANTLTVDIVDNDGPATNLVIILHVNSVSTTMIDENATGVVTVSTDAANFPAGGIEESISFDIMFNTLSPATAEPEDFTGSTTNSITLSSDGSGGLTSTNVTLQLAQDVTVEGTESFAIIFAPGSLEMDYPGITTTDLDVDIVDTDVSNLELTLSTSSTEGSEGRLNELTFFINIVSVPSGGIENTIVVPITFSGLAENGLDYSPDDSSVFIPPCGSCVTDPISQDGIIIDTLPDNDLEGDETFVAAVNFTDAIFVDDGFSLITFSVDSLSFTITDENIAGTSLVASSLDTDLEEMDESIIRFCFELQSANTNLAVQNAFNLTFDIVAGTATDGSDYSVLSTVITFAAGVGIEEEQCENIVQIMNDTFFEGAETFSAGFTNDFDVDIVNTTITFSIFDREDVELNFDMEQYSILEGGMCLTPVVVLSTPFGGTPMVSIDISIRVGSPEPGDKTAAVEGDDFTMTADFAFTFSTWPSSPDGTMSDFPQMFCVEDNNIVNDNLTFTIFVDAAEDVFLPEDADNATVLIIDNGDDSPALIELTATPTVISEGSSFQVCGEVLLPGSVDNVSFSIPLLTSFPPLAGLSSAQAEDIQVIGSLEFECFMQGASDCVQINATSDTLLEGDEGFEVLLDIGASNHPGVQVMSVPLLLTITDPSLEDAQVQLENASIQAAECTTDPSVRVCAIINSSADTIGNPFTLEVRSSNDSTATLLQDYRFGPFIPDGCPDLLNIATQSLTSLFIEFTPETGFRACGDVTILDDAIFEGAETIQLLTYQLTPAGATLSDEIQTTITIEPDLTDAILVPSASNVATADEGDTVILCVVLNTSVAIESSISVSLEGVAAEEADVLNASLTFDVGSESGNDVCFTVDILVDNTLEGADDLMFEVVSLEASSSDIILTVMDVADVNALSIALTNTSVEGSEGENITVCATIDSIENIILEIPVIATFEQSPLSGFPELNGDIDIDGVFTFTGMSPSAPVCVDVELLEDRTLEGQEGVALELNVTSVPSVSVNESMDMIQVLITDTNMAKLSFEELTIDVEEGGDAEVCVIIDDDNIDETERTIGVELGSTGVDFGDLGVGSIVIPAFTSAGSQVCNEFAIAGDVDNLLEDEEQFPLYIVSFVTVGFPTLAPSVQLELPCDNATVIIPASDNLGIEVSFVDAFNSITEGESASFKMQFNFLPTNGLGVDLIVSVDVFDDDGDFVMTQNATFFTNIFGDVNDTLALVTILIDDDEILQSTREYTLEISEIFPPLVGIGENSTAVLEIVDNETAIIVIQPSNITVDESDPTGEVCAELEDLPNGGLGTAVDVAFSFTMDTARSPGDYHGYDIVVRISEDNSACFNLSDVIVDDDVTESTETFTVEIVSVTLLEISIMPNVTEVSIVDSDTVKIGFEEQLYSLTEGDFTLVCVVFVGALERSVDFDVRSSEPLDFSDAASATFVLSGQLGTGATPDNSTVDGRVCFYIDADNDTLKEDVVLNILALTSADDGVCLGRDIVPVRTEPNGVVTVSISDGSQHILTNESSGFVWICVEADHDPRASFSVTLTTEDVTAEADEDYVNVTEVIEFYNGGPRVQCVSIPILNDEYLEVDTESFNVTLSSTVDCVIIGNGETQVYIQDDDGILVGFTESLVIVKEDDNETMACVEVCAGVLEYDVTIFVLFNNGTAVSPGDFEDQGPLNFTFTPDNFEIPYCFLLPIEDDEVVEFREELALTLQVDADHIDVVRLKTEQLNVVIMDNDRVFLELDQNAYFVAEEDGVVEVCTELDGVLDRPIFAEILILESTALSADFNLTGGDLTFLMAGQQCVNVTITMDQVLEGTESLLAVLRTQDSAVDLGRSSAPIIISDSDTVMLTFTQSSYFTAEDDGEGNGLTVEVTVLLTGEIDRPVPVYLTTMSDTAIGGEDYYDILDMPMTIHSTFEPQTRRRRLVPQMMFSANFSIIADDLVESEEQFYVILSSGDSDVRVTTPNASIIIENNDFANVSLECDTDIVSESGELEICAVLTEGELAIEIPVNLSTSCVTACSFDFTDVSEVLVFTSNISRLCVNVTITEDDLVERDEYFTVSLSTDLEFPVNLYPNSSKEITIVNDDYANISLVCTSAEVVEDVGQLEVCAVLIEGELAIDIVANLTATCGSACTDDYELPPDSMFTFSTSSFNDMPCVNISITVDQYVESDEVFSLSISSFDPVFLLPNSTKDITILNDDYANISLECNFDAVNEDIGEVEVCAVLLGGHLARNITVNISTTCGTACLDDYSALSDYPLEFPAESPEEFRSCVNISITDNEVVENDEDFLVSINSTDPVNLEPNSTKTITILNDDFVNVSLACDSIEVREDMGQLEVCAVLTQGELDIDVAVELDTVCGEACSDDFEPLTSVSLLFPAESPVNFTSCTNVTIIADELVENDEQFSVSINSSDPVSIQPISTKNITVVNIDAANVSLVCDSAQVLESDGEFEVCAELVAGNLGIPITVHLSTICCEACNDSEPADYEGLDSVPLMFDVSSVVGSRACANVTIEDDDATENDEKFTVELSSCGCDPVFITPNSSKDIVILNNDEVTVGFVQNMYSGEEGSNVTICAELIDGTLQRDVFAMVEFANVSALEGLDYRPLDSNMIVFESLVDLGSTSCAAIMIVNDSIVEGEESFTVTLSPGLDEGPSGMFFEQPVVIDSPRSVPVTIPQDLNDVVYISLECDSIEVSEGDGQLEVCAVLTQGELERNVAVDFNTSCASACSDDFSEVSEVLVFTPNISRVCVNISINDDGLVEYNESFSVLLASSDDAVSLHQNATKDITIIDNDMVYISLECDSDELDEDIGQVEVCAMLNQGELARNVTVEINTECIDACTMDFAGVSGELTFTPNIDRVCRNISIDNDELVEFNESFVVTLTTSDVAVSLHPNDTKTFTIIDNDSVSISLEFTSVEVDENTPELEVCSVLHQGELARNVSVNLATLCGTACESDFVAIASEELVFTPNVDTVCTRIPITNDAVVENDEMFSVSLTTLDGAVLIQPNSTTSVAIIDDDLVYISLECASDEVSEDIGQLEVCAVLTQGELARNVEVDISTECGDACSDDFTGVSTTLVFSSDTDRMCVNISVSMDDIVESDEDFTVSLTSSDEAVSLHPNDTKTIIINDISVVYISLECDSIEVSEDIGQLEVCAVLTQGELDRNVAVNLNTSSGTAGADDFSEVSEVLVFTPSDTKMCVNISIEEDDLVENDEIFSVLLASSDVAVTIHPNDTKEVAINDNDEVCISLECDTAQVREDGGQLEACAVITKGSLAIDIEVGISTSCSGPCVTGDDIVGLSESLFFTPTNARACVMVTILEDDLVEDEEIFTIDLDTSDPAVSLGPNSTKEVLITDNDEVTIGFQDSDQVITEGESPSTVCVAVVSGTLARDVVVSIQTTDVTATAGDDYVSLNEPLTFNMNNLERCRDLTVVDDPTFENDEMFEVELSTTDAAVVLDPSQITATILDDDDVTFALESSDVEVCEGSGPVFACLSLTSGIGGTVDITVQTADISTDSQDYGEPSVVTFGPDSATEQCVEIPITNDEITESCDEQFEYSFVSSEENANLPTDVVNVLVRDDDEVEIAFFDNTPSKTEGLNELTLSIQYGGCFDAANCTFPSGLGEAVCSTVGSSTFTGVFRPAIGSIGRNRFANLTITAFNGQCGVETVYRREVIRVTGGSRCSGILTNGGVVDNGDGTATVTWEPQQILPDLFSCGNDMHLPFVNCDSSGFTFDLGPFPPGNNVLTIVPRVADSSTCSTGFSISAPFFKN